MKESSAKDTMYFQPSHADEAVKLAVKYTGFSRYIAGGTDLMLNRFQDNETSSCLIDITGIEELKITGKQDGFLRIGALTCLTELEKNEMIRANFPVLIEAAASVGSPLVRSSATLGGNVLCENRCIFYNQSEWWRTSIGFCLKCNGDICIATGGVNKCYSEFISDTAPVLICLDARIAVLDENGERELALEEIYTGDGLKPVSLGRTALIKYFIVPLNRGFKTVFMKLRRRESLEFTSLTTAVSLDSAGKLKIAVGGVDPKPVVVEGTRGSRPEDLIAQVLRKARAVDNDMFTRKYRREMIKVFLNRSLGRVLH